MKDKYMKLKAMLLAGTIALSGTSLLSGCSLENEKIAVENPEEHRKTFGVGEHIISIETPNTGDSGIIRESKTRKVIGTADGYTNIIQYEYHEGYKIIGLAEAGYSDNTIIYQNEYPVECECTSMDKDGNYKYETFGKPIDYHREETNKTETTKEFNTGEHIISIWKFNFKLYNDTQLEYHEGYDIVGISENKTGNVHILYENNQPVTCTLTDTIDNTDLYLSFGTPIEKEKTKVLD